MLSLNELCSICHSYTGRVELPDNLKSFFRPVAMMVPDTNMITEVLLFINCFTTASTLALKVTKFYEMIKSQISHQVGVLYLIKMGHVMLFHCSESLLFWSAFSQGSHWLSRGVSEEVFTLCKSTLKLLWKKYSCHCVFPFLIKLLCMFCAALKSNSVS